VKKSLLKLLLDRDKHCWHCGDTETLVPHHRKNRGMGGRGNSLNTPANLILVCARYNLEMESDSKVMVSALVRGHKLRQTDSFFEPIFDNVTNQWFILDNEGRKNATNSRSPQF
jgi:hypothetical protein